MKKTDPVSTLTLDVSTRNALTHAGAETIGDLMYLIRTGKLMNMRNIGLKGYYAIIRQVGMNDELWGEASDGAVH